MPDPRRVAAVAHILNVSYGLASEVSSCEADIEYDMEITRRALQALGVTVDELDAGEKAMFSAPWDF